MRLLAARLLVMAVAAAVFNGGKRGRSLARADRSQPQPMKRPSEGN